MSPPFLLLSLTLPSLFPPSLPLSLPFLSPFHPSLPYLPPSHPLTISFLSLPSLRPSSSFSPFLPPSLPPSLPPCLPASHLECSSPLTSGEWQVCRGPRASHQYWSPSHLPPVLLSPHTLHSSRLYQGDGRHRYCSIIRIKRERVCMRHK